MKKKFLSFLLALVLILPCTFALTACGGDPDEDPNPEFTEFATTATSVMSNYDMSSSNQDEAPAQPMLLTATQVSQSSQTTEERVYEAVKSSENREIVSNVNYYFVDILEQMFTFPLGAGDVLTQSYGATSFYGLKTKVTYEENSQNLSAFVVEKNSGQTVIKMYDKLLHEGATEFSEEYVYATIDYRAKDDFVVTMLRFDSDFSNFNYAIATSDNKLTLLTKYTWNDETEWRMVTAQDVLACYETEDLELIQPFYNEYYQILNSKINFSSYKTNMANLPGQCTKSITDTELYAAFDKYVESGESGIIELGPFSVYQNVLDGGGDANYINKNADGSYILPTNAHSMNVEMTVPNNDSFKKIIIPTNITKLVCMKNQYYSEYYYNQYANAPQDQQNYYLQQYQDFIQQVDQNPEEWQVWMEAPASYVKEHFRIAKDNPNSEGNEDAAYIYDFEVDVAEGSTLFEKKADGNIYAKVDGEEILVYVNNKNSLTFNYETVKISGFNAQCQLNENLTDAKVLEGVAEANGISISNRMSRYLAYGNTTPLLSKVKNIILEDKQYVGLDFLWDYCQTYGVNITSLETVTINLTGDLAIGRNLINLGRQITNIDKLIINSKLHVELNSMWQITLKDLEIQNATGLLISGSFLLDFDELTLPEGMRDIIIYNSGVSTTGDFTINIPRSMKFSNEFGTKDVAFDVVDEYEKDGKKIPVFITPHFIPNMGDDYKITLKFNITKTEAQEMYDAYISRTDDESAKEYLPGWLAIALENSGPSCLEEVVYKQD